jgi:imidazolonepropionase-like amidohydrolase
MPACRSSWFVVVLLAFASGRPEGSLAQERQGVGGGGRSEIVGGKWFDGEKFVARTAYVVDGYFVAERPPAVDRVIRVDGSFVVPPYGDAHTHNLAGAYQLAEAFETYRRQGIYYALVLGNSRRGVDTTFRRIHRGAIDIAWAFGALTSTLGHPFLHYEPRAMGLHDPSTWRARIDEIRRSRVLEDDGYWFLDTPADVEAKLPSLLLERRGHVKIILFHSERHGALPPDTLSGLNLRGLDPSLVPGIVRRAHAAGLRVAAHVESVADFEVAVRTGVDLVAHLPGYNLGQNRDPAPFRLPEELARLAGERGVVVTPQYAFGLSLVPADTSRQVVLADLMRHNLGLLRRHGVRVAVGADMYRETAWAEIEALRGLDLWSNAELLRMWSDVTPSVVFPTRRVGRLAPGYEASFLALDCSPLERFECTQRISQRVKQGQAF